MNSKLKHLKKVMGSRLKITAGIIRRMNSSRGKGVFKVKK